MAKRGSLCETPAIAMPDDALSNGHSRPLHASGADGLSTGGSLAFLGIGQIRTTTSGVVTGMDDVARRVLALEPSQVLERLETFGTPGPTPLEAVVQAGEVHDATCWLAGRPGEGVAVVLSGRVCQECDAAPIVHWFVRRVRQPAAVADDVYHAIFEQIEDGVVVHDMDTGALIDANRAAHEMFKHRREQALPAAPHDVSASEPNEADREAYARLRAAAAGEPQIFEWEAKDADGRSFWLEVSLRKGLIGGADRVLAVMRDITDRKRGEAARRETEERLRTILNTTHELVWTLDLEGKFTFVNARGEEATGHRLQDWVGMEFDPLVHPDDRAVAREAFRQTVEGARSRFRAQVLGASGQLRSLLVNTAPLVEDGRIVGMVGMGNDVTDQVRLEDELHKAQKIESLGLLAGGIAHDFNNILTAILGGVTLARRQAKDNEAVVEMLSLSEKACMRARDLTKQLLTFSRGGAPVCRPSNMADLIRETARFVTRGSTVRCELDIDPDLWLVDMDENQISQVLGNLILNGLQAMPSGGTISVRARNRETGLVVPPAGTLQPGPHVEVLVRDAGVGIAAEHHSKIFDPYFTTKVRGSGLGLATSYSIVRRHQGHIDFETSPGVGTTFRILLPAASKRSTPSSEPVADGTPLRARVLLVDDEPMLLEVTALMLEAMGYETETATSGEAAMERFRAARVHGRAFDVVLMDLTMPGGMSGRDTALRLRRIDPAVALVASSGYSNDPVMADHAAYGFDAAVPKPYISGDIDKALRRAMGRRDE